MNIEIKKQRQMNFRETFDFCVSSIRHRFSRSLLTLSVVILAVAFFMYIQCDNLFRAGIRKAVRHEIQQSRIGAKQAAILFSPYSHVDFTRMLAGCDDKLLQQLSLVFGWDNASAERNRHSAKVITMLESCFKELPPGKLQMFLENSEGNTDMTRFCSMTGDQIIRRTRTLGIRLALDREEIDTFIAEYPAALHDILQAEKHWQSVQWKLYAYAGIRSAETAVRAGRSWIIGLSEDQQNDLRGFLAKEKFVPDHDTWQQMMKYLKVLHARNQIAAYLTLPEIRQKWRRSFGTEVYTRLDEKLSILDKEECRDFAGPLKDEERAAVAEATRERLKLNALQEQFLSSENDWDEEDHSRQIYLMTLAFFVCVIGITNAMLMSITERFSEIATLKCLGATDLFILSQIVLEALLLGIIGGISGVLAGLCVASSANLAAAGCRIFDAWNFAGLCEAAMWSLATGIVLTILSSIYPASKAARMAPMEAMRVQ